MRARLVVVFSALGYAGFAFGAGSYQSTRDGKTLVWNDDPKPGEIAAWSGGRDRDGYAKGFGTLTWYRPEPEPETEGRAAKPAVYARYFGNMVAGKFNGAVNVHSKGKTAYAVFADGTRTTRWMPGPAPSRIQIARQQMARRPEVPAEGPAPAQPAKGEAGEAPAREVNKAPKRVAQQEPEVKPQVQAVEPEHSPEEGSDETNLRPAANKPPKTEVDESLRSLAGPPPSLRTNPAADSMPVTAGLGRITSANDGARLTLEEVIGLADAEARRRGYDLADYERPQPEYNGANHRWSLFYNHKPLDLIVDIGKGFGVTIDDRTRKTSIARSR
jgi:hypothetical protein